MNSIMLDRHLPSGLPGHWGGCHDPDQSTGPLLTQLSNGLGSILGFVTFDEDDVRPLAEHSGKTNDSWGVMEYTIAQLQ